MNTNYSVVKDADGRNIVVINDIRFRGKRTINWDEVEDYLKQYIGEFYEMAIYQLVVDIYKLTEQNSVPLF